MNSKTKISTSLVAAAAAFSSQASGAISVTQASSFPLTSAVVVIDETQDNGSGNVTVINDRRLTQTFQVASGFTLDKFYIDVSALAAGRAFDVRLFAVADTNAGAPNNIPSGTNLLTTLSTVTPATISGTSGVLEIDLTGADEIFLAPTIGTAGYALQLNRVPNDNAPFVWNTFQSGDGTGGNPIGPDLYTAGQAYATVLGGGASHGNSDYTLAFTAVPIVVIPEPSTGLLAMLASSVLLLRRRRA